ncbi:MAG: ATP-binding protein [Mycobacteriales bacterium]
MPLRVRLAATFAVVAVLVVVAGGGLFFHLLADGLSRGTDATLRARADPLVQSVQDIGSGAPDFPDQATRVTGGVLSQVSKPQGGTADSSPGVATTGLLTPAQLSSVRSGHQLRVDSAQNGTVYRVLAVPARGPGGIWSVAVAIPLGERRSTLSRVRSALVLAGAAIVLLGTAGAWVLAGAALRPVERMRRSASEISAADVAGRVVVPDTHDELSALGRTFNALLDRLGQSLARQRQLVADAGHELRNPLAVLRAELELAGRPDRSRQDLVQAVAMAAEETERLSQLANDLLFLASSDDGAPHLVVRRTLVAPLLQEAAAARAEQTAEAGVSLRVEAPAELVGQFDRDRIRQAVDNLLDNAYRVSGAGDEITVRAASDGDGTVIEVMDTGPGFPPSFLTAAFERFARPDDPRGEHSGGTGLGLAIVRAIAEGHGGSADAGNRVGRAGAWVRLRLPGTG